MERAESKNPSDNDIPKYIYSVKKNSKIKTSLNLTWMKENYKIIGKMNDKIKKYIFCKMITKWKCKGAYERKCAGRESHVPMCKAE